MRVWLLIAAACGPPTASISKQWVVVGGPGSVVIADAPHSGAPLAPTAACLSNDDLQKQLGDTCPRHEKEAAGTADMTGGFGHGANPTPGQVRWYCSCPMVARVVLDRCDGGDTFSVREIALAPRGSCK
jgi:hypothetical protein